MSLDWDEIQKQKEEEEKKQQQEKKEYTYDGGFQDIASDDFDTSIDIIFVIDITKSMEPFIANVKALSAHLGGDIIAALAQKNRRVTEIRAQVIGFRDFYCDDEKYCIEKTDRFYDLLDETDSNLFVEFVNTLEPKGGGDIPECSLEALAMAMKILNEEGVQKKSRSHKTRHIIVMCTDASAHPIGEDRPAELVKMQTSFYPSDMPRSFASLKEAWEGAGEGMMEQYNMDKVAKRLVLFTNNEYPWEDITVTSQWTQTMASRIVSNEGGRELDTNDILKLIADSV